MSERGNALALMVPEVLYVGLHETDDDMAELWVKWTGASLPALVAVFHSDYLPRVPGDDTECSLLDELREHMRNGGLVPLGWNLTGWAFATLDSMTIDEFFSSRKTQGE